MHVELAQTTCSRIAPLFAIMQPHFSRSRFVETAVLLVREEYLNGYASNRQFFEGLCQARFDLLMSEGGPCKTQRVIHVTVDRDIKCFCDMLAVKYRRLFPRTSDLLDTFLYRLGSSLTNDVERSWMARRLFEVFAKYPTRY